MIAILAISTHATFCLLSFLRLYQLAKVVRESGKNYPGRSAMLWCASAVVMLSFSFRAYVMSELILSTMLSLAGAAISAKAFNKVTMFYNYFSDRQ